MKKYLFLIVTFGCFLAQAQVPFSVPTNGLVGYWPFTGNANDVSGNANNGTFVGASTFTADRFGNANSAFHGGTSYVTCPSSVFQFSRTSNFSISAWFTKSTTDSSRLLSTENPEGNFRISISGSSVLSVQFGDYLTHTINDTNWHHVVYTYENRTEKIYIDGVLVSTNNDASTEVLNYGSPFTIGAKAAPSYDKWNGKIDDIGVWNRALTAQEIANLYSPCTIPTDAPTGTAVQTFCANPAPTIASLTATGTTIQWYAAATGGAPLATTTTLVDGTTYYASQTVTGCESPTRLAVTVNFNDPQISASATSVCSGTPVTLSIPNQVTPFNIVDFSTKFNSNPSMFPGASDLGNMPSGNVTFNSTPFFISNWTNNNNSWNANFEVGNNPRSLVINVNSQTITELNLLANTFWGISGPNSYASVELWNNSQMVFQKNLIGNIDIRDYIQNTYTNSINNTTTINAWNNGVKRIDHQKMTFSSPLLINKIIIKDTGADISQRLFVLAVTTKSLFFEPTYLWSTGATTASINPAPTTTTTYWCDVTINGVTCRKEITITVNPNITPTFSQVSAICSGATLAALPTMSTNSITGSWSPAVNNTSTTTYTFTPTAGQCATTATMDITVNAVTPAPTGNATQVFCTSPAATVANLTASGTAIQWYAAVTGGSPLASTTVLVDGTTYYASQTVMTCESPTRLAVTVDFNDPQITTSATTVCSGTAVTLTVAATASALTNACTLPSTLQTGLAGYWPFCGNANDTSGNSFGGTVSGATLVSDRFGNTNSAYSFDGINDKITVSQQGLSYAENENFSVSLWIKSSATCSDTGYCAGFLSKMGLATNSGIGYQIGYANLNKWQFEYNTNTPAQTPITFNNSNNVIDSNWHFLTACVDKNNNSIKLYTDGVLTNTINKTWIYKTSSTVDPLYFGMLRASNYYYNGILDDISIHNRLLTQNEISQLYTIGQTTYLWSTGATTASINPSPTTTTNYWCDVTINGVTCRKEITITVNPNITPAFTQVSAICSGATLAALPTTSTNSITGTWSPAVNNTSTTTYTFTPTAGQCATTATMGIAVNAVTPAPTGNATQVFCVTPAPTVASLMATGTAIQWYAAATGGAPLVNTAALVDGTTYYASQTVTGCESPTRLAVTVNFNDPQITASATTICSGTSVTMTANGLNGSSNLLYSSTKDFTSNWQLNWNTTVGSNYFLKVSGTYGITSSSGIDVDAAYGLPIQLPYNQPCFGYQDRWMLLDDCPARPTPDMYSSDHVYYYHIINSDGAVNITYSDSAYDDNSGSLTFELYNYLATYQWSTGDITESINVTPTATTTYWCDVTVNGVTCRKEVTINVNSTTPAPTGNPNQVFCMTPAPTVASLTVTGTAIQWYAAASGGSPLASTTVLVDGTTYYASQTVTACESPTRLAVTVDFNDSQITASATTVCSGTTVTLTASTTASALTTNTTLPTNLQNGLVGYWPFNGNANDESGNGLNGIVNGATLSNDRFGNANSAYSFDGINDRIIVNDNAILNPSQITLSTWVKLVQNGPSEKYIINKSYDPTPRYWSLRIGADGRLNVETRINNVYHEYWASQANGVISNNVWHHLVLTYDGQKTKLFLNSNLVLEENQTGTLSPFTHDLAFGYFKHNNMPPFGYFWDGQIDDVFFFNRALSTQEISQLNTIGQTTYAWSTGETTATINPTPTATTTYWCDVTVNGVTCRKEATINVNSTTPAPTGNATQVFCVTPAPTVASLTATGTAIQWYASATGGSPLASTTVLVDGTTYYASQTVTACESPTRLAVLVDFNDPQITASATTVCSGTAVSLSASTTVNPLTCNLPTNLQNGLVGYWPFCGNANDTSVNGNNGTVNGATLTTDRFGNAASAYNFDGVNNNIVVNRNFIDSFTLSMWFNSSNYSGYNPIIDAFDNNWEVQLKNSFIDYVSFSGTSYQEFISTQLINNNNWYSLICTYSANVVKIYIDGNLIDQFNVNTLANSNGNYFFGSSLSGSDQFYNGKLDDIGIWNRALSATEIAQLYTPAPTYLWSTGETTATINPTPTATTTYWCDVTVNGVTCRKEVTITVNSTTPAPTGTATQVFCVTPAPTVASLTATGTAVQWYAAATGGSPLASTTVLVDGTTYYASQTVTACESPTRLAVLADFNDPQITASATTVCSGTAVTLTAGTTATPITNNCTLPTNLQNGLIGYFPFCGNAIDESGNGHDGLVNNSILTSDRFNQSNKAYQFNSNSSIVFSNLVSNVKNNFSYSAWVNTTNSIIIPQASQSGSQGSNLFSNGCVIHPIHGISFGIQNNVAGSGLYVGNNGVYILEHSSGWEAISLRWEGNLTGWHLISVVYENKFPKLFIDGQYISTGIPSSRDIYISLGPDSFPAYTNSGVGAGYKSAMPQSTSQYFNGKIDDLVFFNRVLSPAEISQLYTPSPTYLWSTGETTSTINPTPTATTTYWCDVTVNGVTCRKEATINVNSTTPAPTGNATQVFCVTPAPTVASLTATGTAIQWYDVATGGSPLASTTVLVDGTTYYASQTVTACESPTRLAVLVDFNDPQITASATTVCSGTAVTLTASTTAAALVTNCTLPTNLQNGLVGYWPFCGNANDASGNNNNGTVNGATLTTDRFGNADSAYSFDGINDNIMIPGSSTLNTIESLNKITLAGWFNNQNTNVNSVFSFLNKYNPINDGGWEIILAQNYADWSTSEYVSTLGNGISNPCISTLPVQTWNHIAITYDRNDNTVSLFINGTNTCTRSHSNIISNTNNGPLYFGYSPAGPDEYSKGILDDINLFNRILTSAEIAQLYTQTTQTSYLWSTGATTSTINPIPATTTTYWCDVTVNGVTCRKEITINVTPNTVPTFTQVADICSGATLAALPTTSANGVTGTWSPALDNTATTTYIFTPDAGLCATTATMTINVNPNVTPTFTQVSPICSGATLAALPTTSNNGITGTWSPALDTNATTDYTFTPTVGLCATTAAMTITVIPNVTPTFTQVAIICSGATLAALPTTSDNGITGSWSPALDNTATTTYLFTPTTAQCATTATMTINVLPNVVPTFTQVAEICAGAALGALPTTSSNGVIGTWSPAINNMGTTTYTFTPTAGQCASTATMTITVNPNITPVFTQVPAICSGDTLSPLPTTSNNGITGTWSPSLVNTMTLTYTFTPTEGLCATTTTMTITVNRKITPLFSQMSAVCAGTTMTDLPTTSLNGVIGTWSPALNNMVTTTYTFTPAVGQCAFTKTMTVVVNPIPGTPSGATDQNFCQNDAPRINDIVINGSNVVWFASVTSNFPLSGLTYLIDGTTYYAGAYNPTTGCQSVNRFPVTVHITSIEAPVVEAQFTLCEEDNPTLASINTNGTSLVYYDAATNGNVLAATFELVDGMVIYAAQIDLQTGCESVERSPIQIEINNCRLVIYNLITIDGNQANDRFRVENIENYPTNSVQIFNRNGQLIWKTDQYDNVTNAFIGKATEGFVLKGDEYLPTGTYFYVISYYDDYKGETKQVKGFIQIDNKK